MEQETASDVCEYHADNELAFMAFCALQTQWRVIAGMGGAIYQGLEYVSIPVVMDHLRVARRRRAELFAELRIMESAAIAVFNEKRE